MNPPALVAYSIELHAPLLVPANPARAWMDAFPDRHAYRCLPLSIANAHGWCILSPCAFEVSWTGGPRAEDLSFRVLDNFPYLSNFVQSNFSRGIVTFHTGYLFRTPPGWNTWAGGPTNHLKDGVVALTGVIETDWLPYPFTMNWHFTRPCRVRWERGEPFCMVYPVPAAAITDVTPEIRSLESDPELHRQYQAWLEKRTEFTRRLRAGDQSTLKEAWQRDYFLGRMASNGEQVDRHVGRLRPQDPIDMRSEHGSLSTNSVSNAPDTDGS